MWVYIITKIYILQPSKYKSINQEVPLLQYLMNNPYILQQVVSLSSLFVKPIEDPTQEYFPDEFLDPKSGKPI